MSGSKTEIDYVELSKIVRNVVRQTRGVDFASGESDFSQVLGYDYYISVKLCEILQKPVSGAFDPTVLSYQVKTRIRITDNDITDRKSIVEGLKRSIAEKRESNKEAVRRWLGRK